PDGPPSHQSSKGPSPRRPDSWLAPIPEDEEGVCALSICLPGGKGDSVESWGSGDDLCATPEASSGPPSPSSVSIPTLSVSQSYMGEGASGQVRLWQSTVSEMDPIGVPRGHGPIHMEGEGEREGEREGEDDYDPPAPNV
ncbi:hypothetical protein KIPB_016305, partial [Kipferlia bialata]